MSESSAGKRRDLSIGEISKLYDDGLSTHQIAKKLQTVHGTVRRMPKASGKSRRSISEAKVLKWGLKFSIEDVITLYRRGKLIVEIAKELGAEASTIRRKLI